MKTFCHDIRGIASPDLKLSKLYGCRALCLTSKNDSIFLSPESQSQFPFIQKHFQNVGLDCTDKVIWSLELPPSEVVLQNECSFFFFGKKEHAVKPDQKRLNATSLLNSKNSFINLAHKLNVPVPQTFCFSPGEDANEKSHYFKSNFFMKPAVSTSGLGIVKYGPGTSILVPPAFPSYQLQEEVETDLFLNVQYEEKDGRAEKLHVSEQKLNVYSHTGNIYPSRISNLSFLDQIAQFAVDEGIKEIFGFDVAVKGDLNTPELLALECNPRFNSGTYPALVGKTLDVPRWETVSVKTRLRDYSKLSLQDIEYKKSTGAGIIIINWAPVIRGNLQIMVIGNDEDRKRLISEAEKLLQLVF